MIPSFDGYVKEAAITKLFNTILTHLESHIDITTFISTNIHTLSAGYPFF